MLPGRRQIPAVHRRPEFVPVKSATSQESGGTDFPTRDAASAAPASCCLPGAVGETKERRHDVTKVGGLQGLRRGDGDDC